MQGSSSKIQNSVVSQQVTPLPRAVSLSSISSVVSATLFSLGPLTNPMGFPLWERSLENGSGPCLLTRLRVPICPAKLHRRSWPKVFSHFSYGVWFPPTCSFNSVSGLLLPPPGDPQLISPSVNSSFMDCLRDLQSGRSKPKSAHSSAPPRLGMVMVWRTRKCTASITRCRCSSPELPMEMVEALLLERMSCWAP